MFPPHIISHLPNYSYGWKKYLVSNQSGTLKRNKTVVHIIPNALSLFEETGTLTLQNKNYYTKIFSPSNTNVKINYII